MTPFLYNRALDVHILLVTFLCHEFCIVHSSERHAVPPFWYVIDFDMRRPSAGISHWRSHIQRRAWHPSWLTCIAAIFGEVCASLSPLPICMICSSLRAYRSDMCNHSVLEDLPYHMPFDVHPHV